MTAACPACVAAPIGEEAPPDPQALQFSLPTIHCAACIGKVERALAKVPGINKARVNLSLKRLSVTGTVAPHLISETLEQLGYDAYPLDLAAMDQARDDAGRALIMRMAVAGFAMMNVMLLSVAVWSGAADATRDLFHLISAAIALPVVLYSGQPFFLNAWSALRVRRLNMDVPISLAILLAAGMSLFEALHGGRHAYFDAALSLTFFLLIGRYLDHQTRSAAQSAAKELTALEVHSADRLVKGRVETVPVAELAVGDTISVPVGARVPVDGTLQSDLAILDQSFLTGESASVAVECGTFVQAGAVNLAGPIQITATAVGKDTTLRRMAELVETAENGRNSYTALADRAAQIYAPAVHILALLAFLGWLVASGDVRLSLNIAIAVLIITCPCALGLAVPAVSTAAISRLFSKGFLVKHATALERLAEVDYALFDKTGTLTLPQMDGLSHLSADEKSVLLGLAQNSHHPVSRALVAQLPGIDAADIKDVQEHPGVGISGTWNGQDVRLGKGDWLGATFAGTGLQLGNKSAIPLANTETLRPGALDAITELDMPAEVVTGDNETAAKIFAEASGLPVTAGTTPEGKVERLNHLADQGHSVLMVGDGLNDTGALASAFASMAPGRALEASRSAADVVILQDSFEDLPLVLRIARFTRDLSHQNFWIAAGYNLIAIPIALAGYATPLAAALAMSASSITVLLNSQRIRSIK